MPISAIEKGLRERFGISLERQYDYRTIFRHLGAFWPMWNLHQRKCDKSGKPIISAFRPDCPYPVWHRDVWFEKADPPAQEFDFSRPFFEQAWELFQKSPIPHVTQTNNENCEYTDDWYLSRNCYLCHSGNNCEDCRYCFGVSDLKDVYVAVFSSKAELCMDVINSANCFSSAYILGCNNVYDSAFLYDCRDCSDCLFCFNLRNKKYCFANQQLTKEEFEAKKKEWDFSSRTVYEQAKTYFAQMMREVAWLQAQDILNCENSSGNYILNCKDCENCHSLLYHENCVNVCFSGPNGKSLLDCMGTIGAELCYLSTLPVYCYDARYCFFTSHCKYVEYCAYMQNCKNCFGCCGLVNEEFCIFNRKYSEEEYKVLVEKIKDHMKKTGEYGQFFPGYFAPNPYDESYSGYHYPLVDKGQYRDAPQLTNPNVKTAEISEIPDSLAELTPDKEAWIIEQVFWDEQYQRPFKIQPADIKFARRLNLPLPHSFYVHRIQDALRWMPMMGDLRDGVCAKSGKPIKTNWPHEFDSRILCEEEYLKTVL